MHIGKNGLPLQVGMKVIFATKNSGSLHLGEIAKLHDRGSNRFYSMTVKLYPENRSLRVNYTHETLPISDELYEELKFAFVSHRLI